MEKRINKTVLVGVSGGVDSSVAAAILKDKGYNVIGVFIRTWTPDFIKCTWKEERRDAMRVCAHLGIPFLECDAENEYKNNVADYMIEEYKKGRTPNPDVMCNREIKFGIFWKFAKEHGADFIATGHYTICEERNSFREVTGVGAPERAGRAERDKELREKLFFLKQSNDTSKDQSYFLWTLKQEDLSHILFPIGHMKKNEVRKKALKYKLPTATKKDSQGVCFLGPLDMKDFLKHFIKEKIGDVLDEKGEIIGHHNGAMFFTLGERRGFTITKKTEKEKPYYIIAKNVNKNTITVSTILNNNQICTRDFLFDKKQGGGDSIYVYQTNWITNQPLVNKNYQAQVRYHGGFFSCKIIHLDYNQAEIKFKKNILVDSGQSIVIYDNNICMGGGIVK